MISYYTETNKFIYVIINNEDARDMKLIDDPKEIDANKEVHLTTDYSYNLYLSQRKVKPSLVHIYQTQKELNIDIEILGFFI